MALLRCDFYSESLELSTSMTVILPQRTQTQIGQVNAASAGRHKTLYLLHGLSDDDTIWVRRTSIERYVAPLGIAVVMPSVHRSFYTDMASGGAYETFVAEELPKIARSFFPLSDRRGDTYVAGLSMGGYGAFKLALTYPERYCAAASLSGAVDVARRAEDPQEDFHRDFVNIFGPQPGVAGTRDDLFFLVRNRAREGGELPRLHQCCGEDDFLFEENIRFRDHLAAHGLPATWQSDPGYAHTWDYWDLRIQTVLAWMFPELTAAARRSP